MTNAALYCGLALILSAALTAWLQGRGAGRMAALDHPTERSLHTVPTPRTGGIAIAVAMLPAMIFLAVSDGNALYGTLLGWLLVFAVSLFDDIRSLPFWARLPVHIVAALPVLVTSGLSGTPVLLVFGLLWLVWGTNLFNFMDGMDGLAGSMALIGGSALGIVLWMSGAGNTALLAWAAAAAAAGFLLFNRPPARIFMGDAGSASLGFLFAATSIDAASQRAVPVWVPLLIFLPFIADATFTLLFRLLQRKPVWRAHREHAYQTLVLSGWPAGRVLAAFVLSMLLCGGAGLISLSQGIKGWGVCVAFVVVTAVLYWVIILTCKQKESRDKRDWRE